MGIKIKICGLKRPEDIDYVNEFKPDYAGFVFFPPSSRYVTVDQAKVLSQRLAKDITPVGVFLDNSLDEIAEVERSGTVKILQLHGKTAPELVTKLKATSRLEIWEAIEIKSETDVAHANESPADMILLDNGLGGTGQSFDWSLLKGLEREFFIAGGINSSNVRDAISLRPYGVDTSSGVETAKIKDRDKIEEFIKIVRTEEGN